MRPRTHILVRELLGQPVHDIVHRWPTHAVVLLHVVKSGRLLLAKLTVYDPAMLQMLDQSLMQRIQGVSYGISTH